MRTLLLVFILFASITAAQFVAALIANSLSLLGDCASMLVDTLSYFANIFAECGENSRKKKNDS
eukprot:UN28599